ncbi:MAG: hypothetical protein HC875_01300 [Anaerolineales bacterium]|nr:hypothetical protein [Anaerolineales bacterium]
MVIRAAVTRRTIEAVCHDLVEVIDGKTIRGYLNDHIRVDRLDHLEQQGNQMLVAGLPHRLWKVPLEIAIDRPMRFQKPMSTHFTISIS